MGWLAIIFGGIYGIFMLLGIILSFKAEQGDVPRWISILVISTLLLFIGATSAILIILGIPLLR